MIIIIKKNYLLEVHNEVFIHDVMLDCFWTHPAVRKKKFVAN